MWANAGSTLARALRTAPAAAPAAATSGRCASPAARRAADAVTAGKRRSMEAAAELLGASSGPLTAPESSSTCPAASAACSCASAAANASWLAAASGAAAGEAGCSSRRGTGSSATQQSGCRETGTNRVTAQANEQQQQPAVAMPAFMSRRAASLAASSPNECRSSRLDLPTWQGHAEEVRLPALPPHTVYQGGVANRRGAKDDAAQGGGRGSRRPKCVQQAQRAELRYSAAKGMPARWWR